MTFPKAHTSLQDFGAGRQPLRGHETQLRPWALRGGDGAFDEKTPPKSHGKRDLLPQVRPSSLCWPIQKRSRCTE